MTGKLQKVRVSLAGKTILPHAKIALDIFSRMKGLLGTSTLQPGEALIISDCKQVHTFFMAYPIDVVFLDHANQILKCQTLQPWRISPWIFKCRQILEAPAGFSQATGLQPGHQLEVTPL